MSYIDELERDLVRAGRDYQARNSFPGMSRRRWSRSPRARRLTVGGLLATAALVPAVAIMVFALTTVGRGTPPVRPVASSGPAARQLRSMLAILRRPQTGADLCGCGLGTGFSLDSPPSGQLVRSLSRLAVSLPGWNVYVTVARPTAWPNAEGLLWAPSLGDQVGLSAVNHSHGTGSIQAVPAADLYAQTGFFKAASTLRGPVEDLQLVPDGVVRVRWVFHVGHGTAQRTMTIYPRISNNVAFATTSAAMGSARLSSDTWYARDGRAIPRATRPARLAAARAARFYEPAPAMLRDFAVFRSRQTLRASDAGITISIPSPTAFALAGFGLRGAARYVSSSHASFFAIATERGACLMPNDSLSLPSGVNDGAVCSSNLGSVLAHGLWETAAFDPASFGESGALIGIVPATSRTVTVQLDDGHTRVLPVADGVIVTPAAGIKRITVKGVDDATRTIRAP